MENTLMEYGSSKGSEDLKIILLDLINKVQTRNKGEGTH